MGLEVWRRAFAPSSHLQAPCPSRRAGLLKLPTGWILSLAIIKVSRAQWRLYVPLVTPGGSSRERGGAPIPTRERSLRAATSHSRLLGDRGATNTRRGAGERFQNCSFKKHGEIFSYCIIKLSPMERLQAYFIQTNANVKLRP